MKGRGLLLWSGEETENGRFPIWINWKPSSGLGWRGKRTSSPPSTDATSQPVVRVIKTPEECASFDGQLEDSHGLGASRPTGDFLQQVVEMGSKPLALLAWGSACHALKDRDRWISWTAPQRVARLLALSWSAFDSLAPRHSSLLSRLGAQELVGEAKGD